MGKQKPNAAPPRPQSQMVGQPVAATVPPPPDAGEAIKTPQFRAPTCPECGGKTRVRETEGRVRRVVCGKCGWRRKFTAPPAFAVTCPTNAAHPRTRVVASQGILHRCICDDCGVEWTQNTSGDTHIDATYGNMAL